MENHYRYDIVKKFAGMNDRIATNYSCIECMDPCMICFLSLPRKISLHNNVSATWHCRLWQIIHFFLPIILFSPISELLPIIHFKLPIILFILPILLNFYCCSQITFIPCTFTLHHSINHYNILKRAVVETTGMFRNLGH